MDKEKIREQWDEINSKLYNDLSDRNDNTVERFIYLPKEIYEYAKNILSKDNIYNANRIIYDIHFNDKEYKIIFYKRP